MSKDLCCGNCKHFKDEDVNGFGLCGKDGVITRCNTFCSDYSSRLNGWTEITPDNVHEVYEKRGNIAFMNPTLCDYATIWHNVEIEILELYVRKGGYYYYVLPEFKLED